MPQFILLIREDLSKYPMPEEENIHSKPKRVAYPQKDIKYRHYGSILENVVNEVKVMDDGAEKKALTDMVANFMKHLYLTYNRDTVNDDVIFEAKRYNHLKLSLEYLQADNDAFTSIQKVAKKIKSTVKIKQPLAGNISNEYLENLFCK